MPRPRRGRGWARPACVVHVPRGVWSAGYCVCSLHLRKLSIQILSNNSRHGPLAGVTRTSADVRGAVRRCAVARAHAQSSPTQAAAIMRYAPERTFTAAQRPRTAAATGRHAAAGHPTPHTHRRAPCHHSHPPPATACRRQGLAFGRRRSPPKTCEPAGGAAGSAHLRTSRGSRQSRQQRRARPRQQAASKRLRGGRTGSHLSQGSRPAGPAPLPARAGPSPTFTTSLSAI